MRRFGVEPFTGPVSPLTFPTEALREGGREGGGREGGGKNCVNINGNVKCKIQLRKIIIHTSSQ